MGCFIHSCRSYPLRFRQMALCLFSLLAAISLPLQAADLFRIPGRTATTQILTATGDAQMLVLEGRFVSGWAEGGPRWAIRLLLNDVLLDANRILGPHTVYAPKTPKLLTPARPRYAVADRTFAFLSDTDFIEGNGPYPWDDERSFRVIGCPPVLQLTVRDLLRPGANTLTIINGAQESFEVKQVALLSGPLYTEEPLPSDPTWPMLAQSAEMRTAYQNLLRQGELLPAQQAHLLAALGTAEFLRPGGRQSLAFRYWRQALMTSRQFDLRGEAGYRLAAERLRTGKWDQPGDEALACDASGDDDSWSELTRAVLDVLAGKTDSSARPLIRPAFTAAPMRLDGRLDEPAWATAHVYPITYPMSPKSPVPLYPTTVRFLVQPDGLRVGFTGEMPETFPWSTGIGRDEPIWFDHAVELFLGTPELREYYELDASPLGGQFDCRNVWWWKGDSGWNGRWQVASRLDHGQFAIEYAIPWRDLGWRSRPRGGTTLIVTAVRAANLVTGNDRQREFFGMTRHRGYDPHRLMDGALLVLPACTTSQTVR